jgi:hypothetical protein
MLRIDSDDDIEILKLLRDCAIDAERAAIDSELAAHREQQRAFRTGARVSDIARCRARETRAR